jgi:hypothetical protein
LGSGAAPDLSQEQVLDIDATIVVHHSEDKEGAAPTWEHTFGPHPLYCFLDRPEVSSVEALSGLLRPGNAGSNTADHHERAAPGRQRSFRPRMAPTPVRTGHFQPSNSRWRSYVKDRG